MTDTLKHGTKAWFDRQRRHKHNSFSGFAGMMKANCNTMLESDSLTPKAYELIHEIFDLANKLSDELKKRVDP